MAATQPRPRSSNPELYPSKAALAAAFQIAKQARIPQMPEVVRALQEEMSQPEPDITEAAALISRDLAITGRLLKTVNSSSFNLATKVSSVQQAASLMGLSRLGNLVTAEAIGRIMQASAGPALVIWEAIMEEAQLIAGIAHVVPGLTRDEAYLFGMMHDVGSLIFASLNPAYGTLWSLHSNSTPGELIAYERATMGTDHATLGFLLAGHWQLPDHIALAICHHHTKGHLSADDFRVNQLVALAKLAHYLGALAHGTEENAEMLSYREEAWQDLDVSDSDWAELCSKASEGLLTG